MVTRKEWSKRRGRKSVSERLPAGIADRIRKRDGHCCVYCGRSENVAGRLHFDHIVPRSQGGKDEPTNLVLACARCNLGRRDMPLAAWVTFAQVRYGVTIDMAAVLAQAKKPLPR